MPQWDRGPRQWMLGGLVCPIKTVDTRTIAGYKPGWTGDETVVTPKTTSGQSSSMDVTEFNAIEFFLSVTAVAGTSPTLDVTIESYDEIGENWFTILAFTQKTAIGTERKVLDPLLAKIIRCKWVTGGSSPSFTFTVSGHYIAGR